MNTFVRTLVPPCIVAAGLVSSVAYAVDDASFVSTPDRVARGKYLVTIAGCNDCHTPLKRGPNGPEPDWSRMLSGHPSDLVVDVPAPPQPSPWTTSATATSTAWSGEWGVSFTANLTPDMETGLGKWTFRNFKDTIRTGRHMGRGRAVLPPMPIPMYKHMTDADLEAVFAYLRSVPAVVNKVPEPLPPSMAASNESMPAAPMNADVKAMEAEVKSH